MGIKYKSIIIIVQLILIMSCNTETKNSTKQNQSSDTAEKKSLDEVIQENIKKSPKSDTIALNFYLGESEENVQEQINTLINTGKIQSQTSWEDSYMGSRFVITGYPYEMFIDSSTSINTIMTKEFYNNKLSELTFYAKGNTDIVPVLAFLKRKLGLFQYFQMNKIDEMNNSPKYYWFDCYRETILTQLPTFPFIISYTDSRVKFKKESDSRQRKTNEYKNRKNDIK